MSATTQDARIKNHKTISVSDLDLSADVQAAGTTVLRPDLNGLQVKLPNHPAIYLIDAGYKRLIPDESTYHNLFVSNAFVVVVIIIYTITTRMMIAVGAPLVTANNDAS